ncbi:MAG: D-2-hydroxyacid dehydrogenase (NADP+) [Halieaceae bacterium]|jgi:D-2-hydroxyacid dehydrogenase (NADP+)
MNDRRQRYSCFLARLLAGVLLCVFVVPYSLAGPGDNSEAEAVAAMIDELGLRESSIASRDLPGWKKPSRIVLYGNEERRDLLAKLTPGVSVAAATNATDLMELAAGAEVVIAYCAAGLVFDDPALRWFQSMSAGVEHCQQSLALGSGRALVTNAQGLYGPEMAEHVMAMALSLTRGIDVYQRNQMNGVWQPSPDFGGAPPAAINGQTMLVVGLGGIGRQIAQRANALGMRVLAIRNSSTEGPDYVDRVGLAEALPSMVREADIVVNVTPLTAATTGLFDRDLFAAMKPTAYFINVGRGKSVVTEDLVAALQAGEIAGAGLDVTEPEPLPVGHKLWTMPRVIITPHRSAVSSSAIARTWMLVQENLRRYVAGEPLLSVVDVGRGY